MTATDETIRAWLTVNQVADRYQMPAKTVRLRIRQKVLRAKNVGTALHPIYRVSAQEIRRFDQKMDA